MKFLGYFGCLSLLLVCVATTYAIPIIITRNETRSLCNYRGSNSEITDFIFDSKDQNCKGNPIIDNFNLNQIEISTIKCQRRMQGSYWFNCRMYLDQTEKDIGKYYLTNDFTFLDENNVLLCCFSIILVVLFIVFIVMAIINGPPDFSDSEKQEEETSEPLPKETKETLISLYKTALIDQHISSLKQIESQWKTTFHSDIIDHQVIDFCELDQNQCYSTIRYLLTHKTFERSKIIQIFNESASNDNFLFDILDGTDEGMLITVLQCLKGNEPASGGETYDLLLEPRMIHILIDFGFEKILPKTLELCHNKIVLSRLDSIDR